MLSVGEGKTESQRLIQVLLTTEINYLGCKKPKRIIIIRCIHAAITKVVVMQIQQSLRMDTQELHEVDDGLNKDCKRLHQGLQRAAKCSTTGISFKPLAATDGAPLAFQGAPSCGCEKRGSEEGEETVRREGANALMEMDYAI